MESPLAGRAACDETTETALLAAYRELGCGHPSQCLALLEEVGAADPLGRGLVAVARGMQALERGEAASAEKHFSRAYGLQVPARQVLQQCASFFRGTSSHERAYEAHCLLAQFDAGAFHAYWPQLTAEQRFRYACWAPDAQTMLAATGQGTSAEGAALLRDVLAGVRGPAREGSGMRSAYEALESGLPELAVERAEPYIAQGCRVARGIRAVAQALLARRDADAAASDRLIDEAWLLGNPLPVLLRIVGEHHQARPDGMHRAFECFSLIERVAPGTTLGFWRQLPVLWRLRYAPYLFRVSLLARKPHMYSLRRHKRMIADRFGLAGLAILMGEIAHGEPPAAIARLPVVSLHDHARGQGAAFEIIGAPRLVRMRLPRIIGAMLEAPLEGTSRAVFTCVLKDAVVTGKSNAVVASNALLLDFQGDERERLPAHVDFNFQVLEDGQATVAVLPARPAGPAIPEALKLTGVETSNFGHWTMEYMFQLWACMKHPDFEGVPVVIDAQMPPQHREALEFFAGPGRQVLTVAMGENLSVARLWTCSKVVYWPGGEVQPAPDTERTVIELADADLLARMLLDLQPRLDSVLEEGLPPVKLYLTRNSGQARPLEGRAEVERFFGQRGFTVVDPASLTFANQLRLLRRASAVVLQAGSAVYSLLYCRPGARIGYFPTDDPPALECVHEVFQRLGHKMVAFAPPPGSSEHRPVADFDMLARLLDEMEAM